MAQKWAQGGFGPGGPGRVSIGILRGVAFTTQSFRPNGGRLSPLRPDCPLGWTEVWCWHGKKNAFSGHGFWIEKRFEDDRKS